MSEPTPERTPGPTYRQILYASALLALLGSVGGMFMTGAKLVSKLDNLTTEVALLHDTPQQVQSLVMRAADTDRRLNDLEVERKIGDERYTEMKLTLQSLSDGQESQRQSVGDIKSGMANLLDAVTGRPYRNSAGREIR